MRGAGAGQRGGGNGAKSNQVSPTRRASSLDEEIQAILTDAHASAAMPPPLSAAFANVAAAGGGAGGEEVEGVLDEQGSTPTIVETTKAVRGSTNAMKNIMRKTAIKGALVERKQMQDLTHDGDTAAELISKRHLREMCQALEIDWDDAHVNMKNIPMQNRAGAFVDWPYRMCIIYHLQGETLLAFKEAIMRYEESYFLITALLMTIGFTNAMAVHHTDYWDLFDAMDGTGGEYGEGEFGWMRMPIWDYIIKIIYFVTSFSSSLCAFRACAVFTSWYLAVSDTPADMVPVVISRYLIEYQVGRWTPATGLARWVFGGALPTQMLYHSLWYLCISIVCGGFLLGGPVCGGILLLVTLVWYKPLTEAAYESYPIGADRPGTFAHAMQWAVDRGFHKI